MEGEFLLNSCDIHAGQCAPDTARGSQDGLMEVRSVDVLAEGALSLAEVVLVVRCVNGRDKTDRLRPSRLLIFLGSHCRLLICGLSNPRRQ